MPLTLAIIKALLFYAANRLYAVPLGTVLEITRALAGEINVVEGREVLRIRDEVVPLIRIDELAGQQAGEQQLLAAASSGGRGKSFVIVVVSGGAQVRPGGGKAGG